MVSSTILEPPIPEKTQPQIREDWVATEQKVLKQIAKVSPTILGARIQRARRRQGISVREIARRASVSKDSILRLERGGGTHPFTIVKVCDALGLHLAGLTQPEDIEADIAVLHRCEDDRWYKMTELVRGPLGDGEPPLKTEDREAIAKATGENALLTMLKSRLPNGQLLSAVIELYGDSPLRSHPGEEVVYCLKGTLLVTIGGKEYVLREGESIAFWSSEEHRYAPAPEAYEKQDIPVQCFSIWVKHPGDDCT